MKKAITAIISILLIAVLALGGRYAYIYFFKNTHFDLNKTTYVYVDANKNYEQLRQQLVDSAKIKNIAIFDELANMKGYPGNMRTGRYAIKPGEDARTVLTKLQRGLQTPIKITFNNLRLKEDLIASISKQLMFSGEALAALLNDSATCAQYGYTPSSITSMFIPNTYEFYWDVSPEKFVERMNKEHQRFWTEERLNKAQQVGLTPMEVGILASIVEEECSFFDEYPVVAGLYLNRLRRGQLLQADPTLKYAVGDFGLQRIINQHKEIDSPYNTYKYVGLPPGPIRIPSIKGLDAVLNPSTHNYLYMCAKEDFSGRHNFATNLSDHNRNAARYHSALNQRKIYK